MIDVLATASWQHLPAQLGQIFYFVVLPMLLLAGVGFIIQRVLGLDMPTLTRLNFYFVSPAMIYFAIVTSKVRLSEVGMTVVVSLALLAAMAGLTMLVAVLRHVPREFRNAMVMTTIFHNCGNYGLPLQRLAFRAAGRADDAVGVQSYVMITQNLLGFSLGVILAATGRTDRHWRQNLLSVLKFPPVYALTAALLTVQARSWLSLSGTASTAVTPFWDALVYAKNAFVAVALCTLGAQLATVRPGKHSYPVIWSVLLRLLAGPAVGLGIIYAVGASGFLAQVLLVSTCTPTAVNCMLLCLQFDNHPEYAARAVFYSTLLSPLTVTLVVFLARSGILPGF